MKGLSKRQAELADDLARGWAHDLPNAYGKRLAEAMERKGFVVKSDKYLFGYDLTSDGYGALNEYTDRINYERSVK